MTTRRTATASSGVMGPDEFHDRYPWREEPGLDDNAYTNVMAAWVLGRAADALDALAPARREEIRLVLGLTRRGAGRLAADRDPDARAVPRGRHHRPVRRL